MVAPVTLTEIKINIKNSKSIEKFKKCEMSATFENYFKEAFGMKKKIVKYLTLSSIYIYTDTVKHLRHAKSPIKSLRNIFETSSTKQKLHINGPIKMLIYLQHEYATMAKPSKKTTTTVTQRIILQSTKRNKK